VKPATETLQSHEAPPVPHAPPHAGTDTYEAARRDERKRLFAKLGLGYSLHEVLRGGGGGIVDFRPLEINPACEEITGLSAAELLGRRILESFPAATPAFWIEALTGVCDRDESRRFVYHSQTLGRSLEVHMTRHGPDRVLLLLNDVHEQIRAETSLRQALDFLKLSNHELAAQVKTREQAEARLQETLQALREANRNLEDEVATRTAVEQSHERALEDLQRSNRELENFAHVASHDLKEPLRKINSFLGLLEERYAEQLDETGREFVRYAVDGADRMQNLIHDLLEFSRIGVRGNAFEPLDMDTVLDEVLDDLQLRIRETGTRIERAPLPRVTGDRVQLRQLFQNLVENAVKYRREGVAPLLRIEPFAEEGATGVAVADNGIGIDKEFAQTIFEVFRRLGPRTDDSGSGIGLAICKKIVERHGGRIWVESTPGEGSVFRFILPAEETSP